MGGSCWGRWVPERPPLGKQESSLIQLQACSPSVLLQAPSEYETSPEQLFYRIAHLNRGQQYLLWVAAVTSAGRGNMSEKVTIEPAGKGLAVERGVSSSSAAVDPPPCHPPPLLQLQPRSSHLGAQLPPLG